MANALKTFAAVFGVVTLGAGAALAASAEAKCCCCDKMNKKTAPADGMTGHDGMNHDAPKPAPQPSPTN